MKSFVYLCLFLFFQAINAFAQSSGNRTIQLLDSLYKYRADSERVMPVARGFYRKAQKLANPNSLSAASYYMGVFHKRYRNRDSAVYYLDRSLASEPSVENSLIMTKAHYHRGVLFAMEASLDSAAYHFRSSAVFGNLANDSGGLLRALNGLGNIENNRGNESGALALYDSAYQLAKGFEDQYMQSVLLYGMAAINNRRSHHLRALEYQFEALRITETLRDSLESAKLTMAIGETYLENGDLELAEEYLRKGLDLFHEMDQQYWLALSYENLALVYENTDRLELAISTLKTGIAIMERERFSLMLANSYGLLGKLLTKDDELSLAETYLVKGLNLAQDKSGAFSIYTNRLYFAQLRAKQELYQRAIYHARHALDSIAKEEYITIQFKLNQLLEQAYSAIGKIDLAYSHLKRANELRAKVSDLEKTKEIAKIESRYLFEKENLELIETQKRQEAELMAALAQKRLVFGVACSLVAIGLVIGIAIFRSNRALSKKNSQLTELNNQIQNRNIEIKSQRDHLNDALDELEKTQEQLVRSEKMAALGVLSAGIGHEINNPLNYIKGGLEQLNNQLSLEAKAPDYQDLTGMINEGVDRISRIVKSLSHFSRINISYDEHCRIHDILENCLIILENKLKDRIKITRDYMASPAIIIGNEGTLHQVFLNLLANAQQAINEEGEIIISTRNSGPFVEICIRDSGEGILEEHKSRIGDPFFTTKEPGQGTGLGLYITYDLVKAHKGTIHFKSTLGEGTEFSVKLLGYDS